MADPNPRQCLILFGPPGSGKGTQAKFLNQSLGWAHISTGDMLRAHLAAGDALGQEIAAVMQSGALVSDQTVNRMVEERIKEPDCEKGFILDGYPRTVSQAKLLSELLAAQRIPAVVIHLKVDYNVIISRIAGRRQCLTCGALYSVTSNAPTISEVCDYDGSKLIVREDDRPEVVERRLKAYEEQTEPVLAYFKQAGFTVEEIQGDDASPQVIARRIEKSIQEVSV
ncbi:MAG: adenylate kinase [Bryobacterales bacterium]|nr:adenylate kinase [Bryobacterales bacterium]MBV9397348.1 adenylate kinase [Bryobacterales bacterium]